MHGHHEKRFDVEVHGGCRGGGLLHAAKLPFANETSCEGRHQANANADVRLANRFQGGANFHRRDALTEVTDAGRLDARVAVLKRHRVGTRGLGHELDGTP
jgi:hypothetical protein